MSLLFNNRKWGIKYAGTFVLEFSYKRKESDVVEKYREVLKFVPFNSPRDKWDKKKH